MLVLGSHEVLGLGTLRPCRLASDHQDGETEDQRESHTFLNPLQWVSGRTGALMRVAGGDMRFESEFVPW